MKVLKEEVIVLVADLLKRRFSPRSIVDSTSSSSSSSSFYPVFFPLFVVSTLQYPSLVHPFGVSSVGGRRDAIYFLLFVLLRV